MVKLVPVINCDAFEHRDMLLEVINFLQSLNFIVLVVKCDFDESGTTTKPFLTGLIIF